LNIVIELSSLLPKIIHTIIIFFIRCLRLESWRLHQTQIWVELREVWKRCYK